MYCETIEYDIYGFPYVAVYHKLITYVFYFTYVI